MKIKVSETKKLKEENAHCIKFKSQKQATTVLLFATCNCVWKSKESCIQKRKIGESISSIFCSI